LKGLVLRFIGDTALAPAPVFDSSMRLM